MLKNIEDLPTNKFNIINQPDDDFADLPITAARKQNIKENVIDE